MELFYKYAKIFTNNIPKFLAIMLVVLLTASVIHGNFMFHKEERDYSRLTASELKRLSEISTEVSVLNVKIANLENYGSLSELKYINVYRTEKFKLWNEESVLVRKSPHSHWSYKVESFIDKHIIRLVWMRLYKDKQVLS